MSVTLTNVDKARAKLGLGYIFFGTIIMNTIMMIDRNIPTAATDMKKIFYNPDFFEKLSIGQIMTVLAHEALHIMFKHGLRRGHRVPLIWNFACDYSINPILVEAGFEPINGWLYDKKYADMSPEHIYELLMQDPEMQKLLKEQGEGTDPNAGGGVGGDLMEPDAGDSVEKAELERQIEGMVAQAANMARMAGKLPASLARLVDGILNPQVPWQQLLAAYMTRVVQDEESWSRRNRRITEYVLPSRYNTRMGEIIFIGDTSGSITNEELKKGASEVHYVAEVIRPERIRVLWADTKVAGEQVFEMGETFDPKPEGGGGTDMRVPLLEAEKHEPMVVVLITDGHTPWPASPPPYPLIVLCTTDVKVPNIGEVIRIA